VQAANRSAGGGDWALAECVRHRACAVAARRKHQQRANISRALQGSSHCRVSAGNLNHYLGTTYIKRALLGSSQSPLPGEVAPARRSYWHETQRCHHLTGNSAFFNTAQPCSINHSDFPYRPLNPVQTVQDSWPVPAGCSRASMASSDQPGANGKHGPLTLLSPALAANRDTSKALLQAHLNSRRLQWPASSHLSQNEP